LLGHADAGFGQYQRTDHDDHRSGGGLYSPECLIECAKTWMILTSNYFANNVDKSIDDCFWLIADIKQPENNVRSLT